MFPHWSKRQRPDATPPATPAPDEATGVREPDSSTRRALGLLALLELSDELSARAEPSAIARTALLNLMGHYGCSRGALWLIPDRDGDPVLLRAQSVSDEAAIAIGRDWTRWFRAQGMSAPDPVVIERVLRMDPPPPGSEAARAADLAVIAPLTAHERVIGLMGLGRRVGGGEFGRMELEVLRASLNMLGLAVDNARLRNRLIEERRRLRVTRERLRELDREGPSREIAVRLSRGDARAMLESVHEERRPGIVAELRELEVSAATDVRHALFDREAAGRILDAMIDDAAARLFAGSRIRLRLDACRDEHGAWVTAEVRDEGPGLRPDELAALLDAPDPGDGRLGIRSARRLAERMGSRLEAAGEPGHGTVLTLRMPAA